MIKKSKLSMNTILSGVILSSYFLLAMNNIISFSSIFIVFSVLSIALTLWSNQENKDSYANDVGIREIVKIFFFMHALLIARFKFIMDEETTISLYQILSVIMINAGIAALYISSLKQVSINKSNLGFISYRELKKVNSLLSLIIGFVLISFIALFSLGIPWHEGITFIFLSGHRYRLEFVINELFTNAILEELIFRGALLYLVGMYLEKKNLSNRKKDILKYLIVTVLFVLTHPNIIYSYKLLIHVTLGSTIFHWTREKSGNLYVPIILHTYVNLLTVY